MSIVAANEETREAYDVIGVWADQEGQLWSIAGEQSLPDELRTVGDPVYDKKSEEWLIRVECVPPWKRVLYSEALRITGRRSGLPHRV